MGIPAGWYNDPSGTPGALRWWDGERWTDHVALPAPPAPPAPPTPAPVSSTPLTREIDVGRVARVAAIAVAVVQPIQLTISLFLFADLADLFRELFSEGGRVDPESFSINPLLSLASNVMGIVAFAAFVVILVWVHTSATTAVRLGIPAVRSPGWAVGGFLIPVVNLWWPYQSVRDLFPVGNPSRRIVGRWWALYLTAASTPLVALGIAFASVPAAVAVAAVSTVLYVAAMLTLRRVITLAATAHTELAATRS